MNCHVRLSKKSFYKLKCIFEDCSFQLQARVLNCCVSLRGNFELKTGGVMNSRVSLS